MAAERVHPSRAGRAGDGAPSAPNPRERWDIDYPAVMGSRTRLWSKYGDAWGWPPPDMTHEADRVDLARHEAEIAAHLTFNYAIVGTERPDHAEQGSMAPRLGGSGRPSVLQ